MYLRLAMLIYKSNVSLQSLYYAEACNKFARPISASLCPGNTASFEEMLLQWRTVGSTVFNSIARDLKLRPPASETNALPLEQLAGNVNNTKAKY